MLRLLLVLAPPALVTLMALPAPADTLYLKANGKPIAKNIMVIEETSDRYVYLDKSLKQRSYSKSMVGSMTRERTDIHEYKERFDALKDGAAAVSLAQWSAKKRFGKAVIAATWQKAIEFDPANAKAHAALGHVQYKHEWMTPAERDGAIERDEASAMSEKGLVKHNDMWVTPEDKANLENGLVKHDGKWMTADQVKEAQGFVKFGGKWVRKDELEIQKLMGPARRATGLGERLQVHMTENYAVLGDLPKNQLEILGKTMEKLHAEWLKVFPQARGDRQLLPGKQRLYVFKKARPYQKLCKWVYDQYEKSGEHSKQALRLEKGRMKMRQRETSFWEVQFQRVSEAGAEYGGAGDDEVMSAHVQMPDPFEGLKAHCVHFGANILATRTDGVRFPTWWLNEALGYYFEIKVAGSAQTFSLGVGGGGAGYSANNPLIEGQKNPWLDSGNWQAKLLGLARTGTDPKLEKFKAKTLFGKANRLTAHELAKGWSVVTFLILDDGKKFAAFFRDAKNGPGSNPVEREITAVIKHYGSYRKIEERWRKYALNNFRIVR